MSIISDKRKKESDERKTELLKTAVASGCHIFFDKRTGKVAIEGTLSNGTKYPVHVGIAFDKDDYLPQKEYVANMKSLMRTSNLVRKQFIDNENKYSVSSPYEMSTSDDVRFVEATMARKNPMQFAGDVLQDITNPYQRKAYNDYVISEIDNAIKATKLASMPKISTELQKYNDKYNYLLNVKSIEQERE